MTFDPSPPPPDSNHDDQAASWMARYDRGLTAAEQDDFLQWLAAHPLNRKCLLRHQRTLASLRKLAQLRPASVRHPDPDLLAPVFSASPQRRLFWAVGVAAGLVVAAALLLLSRIQRETELPFEEPPILRKVLADGSTIDLNRGAEVRVNYTPEARNVCLVQGEATFTAAKDPARPFRVQVHDVTVQAVGTAFNVNFRTDAVEVIVTEGRVQIQSPARQPSPAAAVETISPPIVEAGQRGIVTLDAPTAFVVEEIPRHEMERILAWHPRELEFDDTPLAQVVAMFNARNRVQLIVEDPLLGAMPLGASLRSDNVEGFVRLLQATFGVRVERRTDGVIVLTPAR